MLRLRGEADFGDDAGALPPFVCRDAHLPQHLHVEVRELPVVLPVERHVAGVLEAPAREEDGQVVAGVRRR